MAERTVPLLRRPWPVLLITTRTASSLDAMMLSHGHWDHAGAMPRALQMMTLANGGRRVPTYMHPDMFASRAVKANDGRLMPMEDIHSEHVLAANGADLIIARNEQSVPSSSAARSRG